MKRGWFVVLVALFGGCCPQREAARTEYRDSTRVEMFRRLVPVYLPPESSRADAVIECDKQGMAFLSQLNVERSRNALLSVKLDSLGRLTIEARTDTIEVFVPSDSVNTYKGVQQTVTVVEYRDRALTRWQQFILDFGTAMFWVIVGLVVGGGVLLYFKFRIK